MSDDLGDGVVPIQQEPALRHRVHEQLENLIITGALAPGSRLVEGDLAGRFGVSRGPIREALQVLARDGFVELRPRHGAVVHEPTSDEINDFFDVRRALESEAARQAARKRDAASTKRLEDIYRAGTDDVASGSAPVSHLFHEAIVEMADNKFLSQMLDVLHKRTNWYLHPFESAYRQQQWGGHEPIVDAVVAGDDEAAAAAMAAHIEISRELYRKLHIG